MKKLFALNTLFLASACASFAGSASTEIAPVMEVAPPADPWEFKIAPYAMLPTLSGEFSLDGSNGGGGISLPNGNGDTEWQFGVPIAFEFGRDKWGIGFEVFWLNYSGEGDVNIPVVRRFIDTVGFDLDLLHTKTFLYYNLYQNPQSKLDVYAGANIIHVDLELGYDGRISNSGQTDNTWVDPMIGLRLAHQIHGKWFLDARGEVGGGTSRSGVTWDVTAAIRYQQNQCWSYMAGYRSIRLDFSSDSFLYEVDMKGPVLGVQYIF